MDVRVYNVSGLFGGFNTMLDDTNKHKENPLIRIAYVTGCSACGVTAIMGLNCSGNAWPIAAAVSTLALMGVCFGYFIYKKQ
jgi:hypothetical protein